MRRALVLALVFAGGCFGNDFDPQSYVGKLRLVAVKADAPEVLFGGSTMLTATAVNPGGPTPAITWDACTLPPSPGTGQATNPDCASLPEGDPSLMPLGQGDSVSVTMPGTFDPSLILLSDQTNGIYLPVRAKLDDGSGHVLTAFYGLRYYLAPLLPTPPDGAKNPPNRNPSLTGIFVAPAGDAGVGDEVPLDPTDPSPVQSGWVLYLRGLVTDDSQESYWVWDGDPFSTPPRQTTEEVRISWYATAGEFENDVTGVEKPTTTWKLDKRMPASGSIIDLWAVARDERGGSDVMHRSFILQ
jgi:hypothetical protein